MTTIYTTAAQNNHNNPGSMQTSRVMLTNSRFIYMDTTQREQPPKLCCSGWLQDTHFALLSDGGSTSGPDL